MDLVDAPVHPLPEVSFRRRTMHGFAVAEIALVPASGAGAFAGCRILQLSDFHLGPCTTKAHVEAAIDLAAGLRPDLVLLTGDYALVQRVSRPHEAGADERSLLADTLAWLGSRLAGLADRERLLAIPGNHDHDVHWPTVKAGLEPHVRWLENGHAVVARDAGRLSVVGLADLGRGRPDLEAATACEPAALMRLLLTHNPDTVLDLPLHAGFDLVLAGHTHGGQVRIPGFGAPVTFTRQRRHVRGLSFHDDGTPVFVSSGIGYGILPIRLFCPPEITLITIAG